MNKYSTGKTYLILVSLFNYDIDRIFNSRINFIKNCFVAQAILIQGSRKHWKKETDARHKANG